MLSSPSSAIMASDSRRPYSIGIEGVYGKYPVAFALIMSPKSKKTRGHLACSRAASALGLAQTSPSPAGSINPFCDPRSEEGRGGEEGRSRGGADHLKKKKKK